MHFATQIILCMNIATAKGLCVHNGILKCTFKIACVKGGISQQVFTDKNFYIGRMNINVAKYPYIVGLRKMHVF